jgi:hypothetical protein
MSIAALSCSTGSNATPLMQELYTAGSLVSPVIQGSSAGVPSQDFSLGWVRVPSR